LRVEVKEQSDAKRSQPNHRRMWDAVGGACEVLGFRITVDLRVHAPYADGMRLGRPHCGSCGGNHRRSRTFGPRTENMVTVPSLLSLL